MNDANKPAEPSSEAASMALPNFCPRDGDILYEGVKTIVAGGNTYNYNAWLCPTCTYWKIIL